jgi:hypothetical protein
VQILVTTTVNVNDTVTINMTAANQTRKLMQITWIDGLTDSVIQQKSVPVSDTNQQKDTITYAWHSLGTKVIVCQVLDNSDTTWQDTLNIVVVPDPPPLVFAGNDMPVDFGDTVKLHGTATDNNNVVKMEWDIGNTGRFVETATGEAAFVAKDTFDTAFLCILRATDNLGGQTSDTVNSIYNLVSYYNVKSINFPYYLSSPATINDTVFAVGYMGQVAYSTDGVSWMSTQDTASQIFYGVKMGDIVVVQGRLYAVSLAVRVVGNLNYPRNQLWILGSESQWRLLDDSIPIPGRMNPVIYANDNGLVIAGGLTLQGGLIHDARITTDLKTWVPTDSLGIDIRGGRVRKFKNAWYAVVSQDINGSITKFVMSDNGITWRAVEIDPLAAQSVSGTYCLMSAYDKLWIIHDKKGRSKTTSIPTTAEIEVWASSDGMHWRLQTNRFPVHPTDTDMASLILSISSMSLTKKLVRCTLQR